MYLSTTHYMHKLLRPVAQLNHVVLAAQTDKLEQGERAISICVVRVHACVFWEFAASLNFQLVAAVCPILDSLQMGWSTPSLEQDTALHWQQQMAAQITNLSCLHQYWFMTC